jgi:hypothetical protein
MNVLIIGGSAEDLYEVCVYIECKRLFLLL